MIESDSLDRITLDNNLLQNGGGLDEILKDLFSKLLTLIFRKIQFSENILQLVSPKPKPLPPPPVPSRPSKTPQPAVGPPKQSQPPSPPPPPLPLLPPTAVGPPLSPAVGPLKSPPLPPTQQLSKQPEKSWWQWQWWGGGNNKKKIKKNITRLYNCYILSLNQNGGTIIHNELSLKIKKRLNKKITELKNLEGGTDSEDFYKEIFKKTEDVIRRDNEVKNSLQPILKIFSIDNIFTQYITNILNNIPNFHETLIWNIIKILMEQKKTEIKKAYTDFITNEQKGGTYNNLNLEGGLLLESLLIIIVGIIIVGVSLDKINKILRSIFKDRSHGSYPGWVQGTGTWGEFSKPHGQGQRY